MKRKCEFVDKLQNKPFSLQNRPSSVAFLVNLVETVLTFIRLVTEISCVKHRHCAVFGFNENSIRIVLETTKNRKKYSSSTMLPLLKILLFSFQAVKPFKLLNCFLLNNIAREKSMMD
jgi:hypothetical protein